MASIVVAKITEDHTRARDRHMFGALGRGVHCTKGLLHASILVLTYQLNKFQPMNTASEP